MDAAIMMNLARWALHRAAWMINNNHGDTHARRERVEAATCCLNLAVRSVGRMEQELRLAETVTTSWARGLALDSAWRYFQHVMNYAAWTRATVETFTWEREDRDRIYDAERAYLSRECEARART